MSTRTSLILQGTYADAFIAKAITSDYISVYVPEDDEDFIYSAEEIIDFEYTNFYRYNRYKSTVLQMFLLYDKIILVDPDPQYDYTRLTETGLVDVVTATEDPSLLGSIDWDDSMKSYAMFLKPFVLDSIIRNQPKQDRTRKLLKDKKIQPRRMYSDLYDYWFVQDREQISKQKYVKLFHRLNQVVESVYNSLDPNSWIDPLKAPDKAMDFIRFRWAYDVSSKVGLLVSLLDLSCANNAVLMQSEFKLSAISSQLEQPIRIDNVTESYQIIRLSLEDAIGSLPSLNSIDDVLRLKDANRKDIQRLIDVLSEVERDLREGHEKGLMRARKEIEKASQELSRVANSTKVSAWSTYLSIPITLVETYYQLPPIAGLISGIIGLTTTLDANIREARNNWIQVVR